MKNYFSICEFFPLANPTPLALYDLMQQEDLTIFDFEDYREFLRFRVGRELRSPSGVKRLNLLRLSQSMGYKSPSLLSMVLQGKRLPSDDLIEALSEKFNLKQNERTHLRNLVKLQRTQTRGKDVSVILKRIETSNRLGGKSHRLSLQQFEAIRDWYCFVIKELVDSGDFIEDPQWISRKLRRKVTPSQAQHALETLQAIGLIARNSATGKLELSEGYIETTQDIPSAGIQGHHIGMMERAKEALVEQPVEARQFNSLCLRFDPSRMAEAKDAILNFARQFNSDFGKPESHRVYQLNIQFFEHTRGGSDEV